MITSADCGDSADVGDDVAVADGDGDNADPTGRDAGGASGGGVLLPPALTRCRFAVADAAPGNGTGADDGVVCERRTTGPMPTCPIC